MIDEETTSGPRIKVLPVLAILLLALLLFGLAFRWVRSAPQTDEQTLAGAAVAVSGTATSQPSERSVQAHSSDKTAVPPAIPTAEATIAPAPTELPLPVFSNPPHDLFQQMANLWDAELVISDLTNTGLWQFEEGALLHPIALGTGQGFAYIIDRGRVLQINLQDAKPPRALLSPGDSVDGVLVLEPLDLALSGDQLLVLDRAGDVYKYDLQTQAWQLDRYDRPVEASSGHYFVAISSAQQDDQNEPVRALLETNYKFAQLYDEQETRIWRLPELRSIDLGTIGDEVYILQRELHDQAGSIAKYRDTSSVSSFAPRIQIEEPRQVEGAAEGLYVLDQGGRRLMLLDSQTGQLLRLVQLPQDQPVSAVASDKETGNLLLAAKDRLYFLDKPEHRANIIGVETPITRQSHDTDLLAQFEDFAVPIGGSNITFRDFQLPGAPRHYRLGIHNGLDFYWQPGTKVLAAGDGTIIRADIDYVDPTAVDLASWSDDTQATGYTTTDILDKYLGRQIWIEHEPGVVSRYAHLRNIEPGIQPGTSVSRGQIIGEVGNSGSPASLESESSDAHLHFELWIDDTFLGQYLRPIETRDWIEWIFPQSR